MNTPIKLVALILIATQLSSCKGTINTLSYIESENNDYKKAYILSSENSKYIEFKFGKLNYNGLYEIPEDDAPIEREIIGNTDEVIKQELEKQGIEATIGKKGDKPNGYDLIVRFEDTWRLK
ncbi:MAG: hypothetical protein N4A74_20800 [Carboxylicivirga sp.]|jgi:hypothetical protein|nr:hypothetical protein [Carboxylicivirga sp.]